MAEGMTRMTAWIMCNGPHSYAGTLVRISEMHEPVGRMSSPVGLTQTPMGRMGALTSEPPSVSRG